MAQTKRKRKTKHRGNAVGMVEVRGRTGRKPTDGEKRNGGAQTAAQRRDQRRNTPPTWKGAVLRGGVAAVIFVAILLVLLHGKPGQAFGVGVAMLALYIPLSYYMDLFIYRRNQTRRAKS